VLSKLLYNIFISLYAAAVFCAAPFYTKANHWLQGRKNWRKQLRQIKFGNGKRIWFHCASLGEFEQARPVIEKLKQQEPSIEIILTFFSSSGYEVRKNYSAATLVTYLPLDTKQNASDFLDILTPDIALFVKYEFWFHFLFELKKRKTPVILFSAAFREEQIFFKWYGSFFRQMLFTFSKIFVQTEQSKHLLESVKIKSEVVKDTRFDRVWQVAHQGKKFSAVEKFKNETNIFVAGSTWLPDEEFIIQLHNENLLPGYKWIIAPHQITAGRIKDLLKAFGSRAITLTSLNDKHAHYFDVLIVDTIGDLSSLYQFGNIAYVGGGFNYSVHNILEAAVYGIPIVFGPNHKKSVEAVALQKLGGAFSFTKYPELKKVVLEIDSTENKSGRIAQRYVEENLGGSLRITDYVTELLSKK
jgi:3-deoxy-D-manno-octulosonic-acid transferase